MKLLDINEFKAMLAETWAQSQEYETIRIDGDVKFGTSTITSEKDGVTIISHQHYKLNEEKARSLRVMPSVSLNVRFVGALVIDNNVIVSFSDLAELLPDHFVTHEYLDYAHLKP
jgi:hypothetical protein